MEYHQLNHTDLRVSRLCFGAMTFGKPADQLCATRMVERCMTAGINFFDTANAYQRGEAEVMLGNALLGKRKEVVLATKVHHKMVEGPDGAGLSKPAIFRAVEDSLRRLQTDYIDLYYLHEPDYDVPKEETMDAMDALVRQGKVRYIASSNHSSWQVCQYHWIADKKKYQAPYIAQLMYNLIARGIEQEFLPMAKELGISIVVYNPLAGGLLTGKHKPEAIPPGRFNANQLYQDRYWHREDFEALEKLKKISADSGRSLISISFAWLLHHTSIACIILGASRMEQLEQNLKACDEGPLPEAVVKACHAVWLEFRGPSPIYNR